MDIPTAKYKLSDYALLFSLCGAVLISYFFKWNFREMPVNFIDGDARDYYSSLISVFIKHDLANQQANEWFILKTGSGTINVHPIGISVLLLPFFLLACGVAALSGVPVDGLSLPFQVSVAVGALTYVAIGLIWLKKLFRLNNISDKISALVILLVFFGTNLFYYTVSEAAMSHAYSFALISVFLYHSCRYVMHRQNKNLLSTAALLGLILLVRPNNIFVILSMLLWFKSWKECRLFFSELIRKKVFYQGVVITTGIVLLQSAVWLMQSGSLFHNTYKADGFYWFHPQILKMLFGFDSGFFIYTPLCLLFLTGLAVVFKENRFSFFAALFLLLVLFWFFASYWAYTYFDGIGIRVLVDYYALFAFFGAKLFQAIGTSRFVYVPLAAALFFLFLNLIYCYQIERGIIYKTGMTAAKWKYTFLKTAPEYRFCLGGSHDFEPYAKQHPQAALSKSFSFGDPYDYSQKDFGIMIPFDSLTFDSNRLHFKIEVARKELLQDASRDALVCAMIDDGVTRQHKTYFQFKLNETPATSCCDRVEYHYTANMIGDFKANDRLSVYLWNIKQQPFLIDKFSVKVYNYNYQLL